MHNTRPFICFLACLTTLTFAFHAYAQNEKRFDVFFAHSMEKIRIDGANLETTTPAETVSLTLAGDESESFQLVVVPRGQRLNSVRLAIESVTKNSDLQLQYRQVGYVMTGNPSYPVDHVGLWPDPLLPVQEFDVEADKVQPLWFTITAKPQCPAGITLYSVKVSAGHHSVVIPLRIRVRNFSLPRPGTFAAPFGLYMNRMAPWYYGPDRAMPVEEFARWSRFVAEYRLTPKNIGYEYVKKEYATAADGSKELVGVNMDALQKTMSNLSEKYFPPYSYGLYRLPSGPTIKSALKNKAPWCTPEKVAAPVKAHYDAWVKQGFAKEVYVYGVDEPVGEEVYNFLKETYAIIKEQVPTCKIMQTGSCNNPKLIGLVDIWCPKTTLAADPFFQDRLKDGDMLWDYVCVSPVSPYANFFIDEPAIDHRILFWQTKKINATGLLYWSTTWWVGLEPSAYSSKDSFPRKTLDFRGHELFTSNWVHVNGDGLLLYPGDDAEPCPSIRLEVIRDGIEDFEYLSLLEKLTADVEKIPKYQKAEGRNVIAAAKELAEVPDDISKSMTEFTKEPAVIVQRRAAIGNMIEQLTDILASKDYEKHWNTQ